MKKLFCTLCLSLCLFTTATLQVDALGFEPSTGDRTGLILSDISEEVDLGTTSPTLVALNLINTALSLLAALCVVLLLYAGFLWIWARGNQEEVKRAKDIILGTVIGLVIVLSALGVTQFVFTTIGDITGAEVVVTE